MFERDRRFTLDENTGSDCRLERVEHLLRRSVFEDGHRVGDGKRATQNGSESNQGHRAWSQSFDALLHALAKSLGTVQQLHGKERIPARIPE